MSTDTEAVMRNTYEDTDPPPRPIGLNLLCQLAVYNNKHINLGLNLSKWILHAIEDIPELP